VILDVHNVMPSAGLRASKTEVEARVQCQYLRGNFFRMSSAQNCSHTSNSRSWAVLHASALLRCALRLRSAALRPCSGHAQAMLSMTLIPSFCLIHHFYGVFLYLSGDAGYVFVLHKCGKHRFRLDEAQFCLPSLGIHGNSARQCHIQAHIG
jgi:hypothetical protein